MRISDWSSDVCSSDLLLVVTLREIESLMGAARFTPCQRGMHHRFADIEHGAQLQCLKQLRVEHHAEIGSASWRERGCQYVEISGATVSLKKTRRKRNTSTYSRNFINKRK